MFDLLMVILAIYHERVACKRQGSAEQLHITLIGRKFEQKPCSRRDMHPCR